MVMVPIYLIIHSFINWHWMSLKKRFLNEPFLLILLHNHTNSLLIMKYFPRLFNYPPSLSEKNSVCLW